MVMLSPGVYSREVDFSSYVQQLSTSILGLVGVFEKGALGATLITSWAKFVEEFGSYYKVSNVTYEGAYLARAFFDNGGSSMYVSRVVHFDEGAKTSAAASKTLVDEASPTAANTIKIEAKSDGTWGNSIYVAVADAEDLGDSVDRFKIVVYYGGTQTSNIVETFDFLDMNYLSEDYFVKKINGVSKYIVATDLLSATVSPANRPAVLAATVLLGGDNGLADLTATDYIGSSADKNGIYAFDAVDDVSMLVVADEGDTGAVAKAVLEYCEDRKDMFGILATPAGIDVDDAIDYRNGAGSYSAHTKFNSTYGALYYPNVVILNPITGSEKVLSPVGAIAGAYANNDTVANVWAAPAGVDRGRLRGVLRAERVVDKGERDNLYSAGINPIATFTTSGLLIWGQKNLAIKASALDRVNVRRLMIYVEKAVVRATEQFVFEPANPKTWTRFTRTVTPFLSGIQRGGGFYAFQVICDATINTPDVVNANQMLAKILVQPTKTAEFIGIDFVILSYGASFTESV